ncbi:glycosyltransferase [Geminocystis herdmanii]|uniref:glycosyltransferase n=1 Tax=Geminocystis herdmanii TaxID=669359 RepID=UPI000345D61D|nr:glycosyltransferase [Geminocystis herdmanii]
MKKFIIIDHSLQDLQGHHFECSVSVAEASQRLNYEAIIIANKNFSSDFYPQNIKIISEFEVDWFNNSTQKLTNFQSKIKSLINILDDFNLDNFLHKYRQKIDYQLFKLKLTQPKSRVLLEKIEGSLFRLIQWIKEDIKLLKFVPLSHTIWGILKIILGVIKFSFKVINKSVKKILLKFIKISHKTFEESLENTLNNLQVTLDDHIFIHTLGIEQLEELLYLLQKQNLAKIPQYHIMLRRDIDDSLVKNAQGIGIKACLNQFYQCQFSSSKVRFYTDTPQLVDRYNSLSPIEFIEIPVPFRQEKLSQNLPTEKENQPLHLVYLGDARIEKGYLHLPNIIKDLWTDYLITKKLRITIQSNFNINSGEKGILSSRLILEQYPESMVKIIKNAMTTEEYYQLLMSADLLVIPYDNKSYRHRTSGVLTESLAAGKPVIVPANTWLASQIDDTRGEVYTYPQEISQKIIKVINNIEEYQKNAQAFSLNWCKKHSPDSLMNRLFSPSSFQQNLTNNHQDIISQSTINHHHSFLFIIQLDRILQLDITGQIILSHLEYLTGCNSKIFVIIYSLTSPLIAENDDLFSKAKEILASYNLQQIWLIKIADSPQFIPSLDKEKYFRDCHNSQQSLTRNLVDINSLSIPESLVNYLQNQEINNIFLDSISSQILVNKLGLTHLSITCQVSQLESYQYAIENNQEIDLQELKQEFSLFNQVKVILVNHQYLTEKIINQYPTLKAYTLPHFYPLNSAKNTIHHSKIINLLWGHNQAQYYQIMSDIFMVNHDGEMLDRKTALSDRTPDKISKNIAILYPWGDILERKAGASQRVGLLIDYLQENNNHIWLFTTGEEKELLLDNIRYTFYEQNSDNFDNLNQTDEENLRENSDIITQDWRWKMYHQFDNDYKFKTWLENIVDWADIVILEYPFWGKVVSKICTQKQVKLIITAHDILCKQVSPNTDIYQTLLTEEINSLKQANYVISVAEKDKEFLEEWGINSQVIPNPVNLNIAQQNIVINHKQQWFNLYPWLTENYCLFVGSGHFPNLEAVKEIKNLASIYQEKQYNPPCKFVVIGNCCPPENQDNFIALGKVESELLTLVYQQAKLVIVPLLSGTGSSLKIAEAMSFSKVIIGTNIAFRGYNIEHKINGIIEDNLRLYPDSIEQILKDDNLLKSMSENAKIFAKKYDYRVLYQDYLNLINHELDK